MELLLAHRRRRRPGLVPGGQAPRRGDRPPARRAADRPPRRRLPRPALRLAAPPADRQRRRGPGPPGPLHRLAVPGRRQPAPGRARRRAQPDPRPDGGSGGQSGTASASFSATSFRSACRRASSSSCKALAMAASCSLATFTLASARPAWACSASAWARAALAWALASAWALAAFAGDSRLGCSLTTVSWLLSLNERTCLALDQEAAAQRAAVCERSHAGDPRGTRCCPEASSNRSPPSSSAIRKARTTGPRQPGPLVPYGPPGEVIASAAERVASLNRAGKDSGKWTRTQ